MQGNELCKKNPCIFLCKNFIFIKEKYAKYFMIFMCKIIKNTENLKFPKDMVDIIFVIYLKNTILKMQIK